MFLFGVQGVHDDSSTSQVIFDHAREAGRLRCGTFLKLAYAFYIQLKLIPFEPTESSVRFNSLCAYKKSRILCRWPGPREAS